MRFTRLATTFAVAILVAAPALAQIPSSARRLGQSGATAPKLLVATPHAFTSSDSLAAVQAGNAMRLRMEKVVGTTYQVVPVKQMNEALRQYGYPDDAILPPAVARRFALELQARALVSSTLSKAGGGSYVLTARLAGVNDDAGNVIAVTQDPGQTLEALGQKAADKFAAAVKSAESAKACVDQRATKPDKAVEAANKAIATLPNHGLAEYCLAQIAQDRKAPPAEILTHLQNAVKGDPQSLPAWTALATQHETRGDSAKVIEAFQQMLLAAPTNQALRETAFKLFLQYGHPDAAVDVAEEGLKLDPTNADLWDLLSNAHATIGNFPKAIDALEQVYENDPSKADSTYYLKITVFAAAQPDTVRLLKWARLGVDKYPENVTLLGQLVTAYSLAGPSDSLVATTTRLIAVDTTAVTPALAAAKTLAEQKKVTQALPFTDFAVRYGDADAKENAAAILTNGAVPMLQQPGQDLPGAAETLRRAVAAANPSGRVAPSANYLLGLATFFQVPPIDKQAEATKSCDLARQEDTLLKEAEAALRLGRATRPDEADKNLGFIQQFKPRVASMLSAYCK